ncbi:MAG: DUF3501 family protein [Planctomycetes bacterium]|nr:DUF3501 family protein [Planctomycetota bacterium]
MLPLTVDDLLPLEEYAMKRKEYFDAHRRYVDRYRRIRVGPKLTLIFENRQTLWFRVQEVIRIARLADAREVGQELSLYNRLLPTRNVLQAALLIDIADSAQLGKELAPWRSISSEQLQLQIGNLSIPSRLITCRPEDRAIGTAHWVQFQLFSDARRALANTSLRAFFWFENETYQHQSAPLSDDFRQSLLDDLVLSDRDGDQR